MKETGMLDSKVPALIPKPKLHRPRNRKSLLTGEPNFKKVVRGRRISYLNKQLENKMNKMRRHIRGWAKKGRVDKAL